MQVIKHTLLAALMLLPATAQCADATEVAPSAIFTAIKNGEYEPVKSYLETHSANSVDQTGPGGVTLLYAAAMFGQTAIAELLLNCDANINAQQKIHDWQIENPLSAAILYKKTETACLLIARGADISSSNSNALAYTVIQQNTDVGNALKAQRFSIATPFKPFGKITTMLHFAAEYDKADFITWLLACEDFDPAIKTDDGNTPLHMAADKNSIRVLGKLIADGRINKDELNNNNKTALDLAVANNYSTAARMLRDAYAV